MFDKVFSSDIASKALQYPPGIGVGGGEDTGVFLLGSAKSSSCLLHSVEAGSESVYRRGSEALCIPCQR